MKIVEVMDWVKGCLQNGNQLMTMLAINYVNNNILFSRRCILQNCKIMSLA